MKDYFPVAIASHTIDVSTLAVTPFVLDVGCRHFDFTRGILYVRPCASVVALDPDSELSDPAIPGCWFRPWALVGDGEPKQDYCSFSTGEGNFIGKNTAIPESTTYEVTCVRINSLRRTAKGWDVVKLDCEGSEWGILENWPGPIAKQISVEFHDYKSADAHNDEYFEKLFRKLAEMGYEVLQHPYYKQGEAWGHWDTLLRLRK